MLQHIAPFHLCLLLVFPALVSAEEKKSEPQTFKHQITGLFSPARVQDLHDVFNQLPQFKLISVDFANAEAQFEYDPAVAFPNAKPEQWVERFDNELRKATRGTFGVKPLCTLDKAKLQKIEISVQGLDCKACELAAYESIFRLPGVETATASFKDGKVSALVDPEKVTREQLEDALKKRGVQLPMAK